MLTYSLKKEFPRLYDLYMVSHRNSSKNYFERQGFILAINRREEKLQALGSILEQMCPGAWDAFKSKTVKTVTVTDKWSQNSALFDRFDEARGYCYLKEQGYSDIEFIPESQKVKTPDLWANRQDGPVLLEVKAIHESDDQKDYWTRCAKDKGEIEAIEVKYFLNDAVKNKLEKTIQGAAEQLSFKGKEARRKILLLCICLDTNYVTQQTISDLNNFLVGFQSKDLEVVYELKNTIFL